MPFIDAHPRDAAAIYIALAKDPHTLAEMTTMVADADNHWTTVPKKLMDFVGFMHTVGRVKHMPGSWKELFLPLGQDGDGG